MLKAMKAQEKWNSKKWWLERTPQWYHHQHLCSELKPRFWSLASQKSQGRRVFLITSTSLWLCEACHLVWDINIAHNCINFYRTSCGDAISALFGQIASLSPPNISSSFHLKLNQIKSFKNRREAKYKLVSHILFTKFDSFRFDLSQLQLIVLIII